MRNFFKIVILLFVISFLAIQFFQPEKNSGEFTENHIFRIEQIPDEIKKSLQNACMDCHSNQTNYLWYHKIAPVSWMVSKHVIDGKDELNFSDWGEMDAFDKIGSLEDIYKEVNRKTMPLKPYVAMHKSAKLSEEQIAGLLEWTKKQSETLTNELNK